MEPRNILEVNDLTVEFHGDEGIAKAVNGVSFAVREGQSVGIVGESGCGKSVSAYSILRLLADTARITSGAIHYRERDGAVTDLTTLDPDGEHIRGISRRRDLDDLPGADDRVQPGAHHQQPDFRAADAAHRHRQGRGPHPDHRPAAAGRHSRSRETGGRLHLPVERRDAPACHDLHGGRVLTAYPDRRRAHHGPRRDHPGAGAEDDPGNAAGAGAVADPDHPRPGHHFQDGGARVRHVPGQGGGERPGAGVVSQSEPPVYQESAEIGAAHEAAGGTGCIPSRVPCPLPTCCPRDAPSTRAARR